MVAYNFEHTFIKPIRAGIKTQTVRSKLRCKVGDTLQLYTGLRTKQCALIARAVCIDTDYCALRPDYITFGDKSKHLSADEFARADGFQSYKDMLNWFEKKYGSPYFVGHVAKWRLLDQPTPNRTEG